MKKVQFLLLLLPILFFSPIFQGCELFYPEEPLGSIHAIYVGLNYHGTDVNYLEGTLNDATELQKCFASLCSKHNRTYLSYPLLQEGGVFEKWGVTSNGYSYPIYYYDEPKPNVTLPTEKDVIATIKALATKLSEKDLTIFSYSGHGFEDGSLVLAPASRDDLHYFKKNSEGKSEIKRETLTSVTTILDALSSLPGKQLLILDTCHSGSFVESSGSSVTLVEKSTFLDEAFSTYFSSERYSPSLFVIAATTADNTSKEPVKAGKIHGYFTQAVLDGLGWDHGSSSLKAHSPAMKKGALTLDSLYGYILENQNFPLKGVNPKQYQHPTITGGAYTLRLF